MQRVYPNQSKVNTFGSALHVKAYILTPEPPVTTSAVVTQTNPNYALLLQGYSFISNLNDLRSAHPAEATRNLGGIEGQKFGSTLA